jgi:hypothetical protein
MKAEAADLDQIGGFIDHYLNRRMKCNQPLWTPRPRPL